MIAAHRISEEKVLHRINTIIMHAGFSMTHLTNDIVLLRLAIAVKLKPFAYQNWGHFFLGRKYWIVTGVNAPLVNKLHQRKNADLCLE